MSGPMCVRVCPQGHEVHAPASMATVWRVLAPNPHMPNPNPPCVGGYRAWPLYALAILRRCA